MKNQKTARLLIASAAILLAAGCMSNVPMDITQSGRDSVLPAGIETSAVRTSIALATHEDTLNQMGSTFSVQSGKVFRRVFAGADDAPASIDLINSRISTHMGAFTAGVTYTVSVAYTAGGQKHILSSTANATTAWTIDRAAREAVERAVTDLAMQARAISK